MKLILLGYLIALPVGAWGGWMLRAHCLAKLMKHREVLLAVEVQRAQKALDAPGTSFERRERRAEYLVLQGKKQEAGRMARGLR